MMPANLDDSVNCPVCGAAAESGCVYAADDVELRWIAGGVSCIKNIEAAIGEGEKIGHRDFFNGTYAEGIRCLECRILVLRDGST